jgi:hypothetical protein
MSGDLALKRLYAEVINVNKVYHLKHIKKSLT